MHSSVPHKTGCWGFLGITIGWTLGGGCCSLVVIKHHYKGLLNFCFKIHELTGGYIPFVSCLRRKIVVYLAFD